jgi:uncharacterized protein YcbX
MKELGQIAAIWRYPTKSLAPQELQSAEIARGGIPGDRGAALVVESGHAREGNTYRGKENNFLHLMQLADDAVRLAAERNVIVRVVQDGEHYFDLGEISILFDSWLDEASSLVGYRLEPLRFRPNFFARANADFAGNESALTGVTLKIGKCRLHVDKPIGRCVTPTYDLQTGASDPKILRAVAQHRANHMGIYCTVLQAGSVRLGDPIVTA